MDGPIGELISALDSQRGVLLASSFEYPGRYSRWDIGFVDPPLALECRQRDFHIAALNPRGELLLSLITPHLQRLDAIEQQTANARSLSGRVRAASHRFPEEERSRQPSIFSLVRALVELFGSSEDHH